MLSRIFKPAFSTCGNLLTWGKTTYGWGRAQNSDFWQPDYVQNFPDVVSVSTGLFHLGFITSDNLVYTTGLNQDGRLGPIESKNTDLPSRVLFPENVKITQLSCGYQNNLALTDDGRVYSWGSQLSIGKDVDPSKRTFTYLLKKALTKNKNFNTSSLYLLPAQNFNNHKIVSVSAGDQFSVALSEKGEVYTWGYGLVNLFLQVNYQPKIDQQISKLCHRKHSTVKKVVGIDHFIMVLLDNGALYSRGANNEGVFGTRKNPLIMDDLYLEHYTKVIDTEFKGEKIVDFEVASNALIFKTETDKIFYSGFRKYQPTLFPIQEGVKKMFATSSSAGVITNDNKIYYLNEQIIENSELVCQKNRLFLSEDKKLDGQVLGIGGTYHLRYALIK